MNVGTMTATTAADPVLPVAADGSGSAARDTGGFAAVLREAGSGTDDAGAGTAPGSAPGTATDDRGTTTATDDAAEAAAAQLLVTWQRSTTTGLAVAAPGEATVAAATAGTTATVLPTQLPQDDVAPEAAVLPEADPVIDLTGMQAVPETPLETLSATLDPGTDLSTDAGTGDPGKPTSSGDQASPQASSDDMAQRAALAGAVPSAAPAAAATSAAPASTSGLAVPTVDAPAPEAPAVDPAVSATPQAVTRADTLAAPTATIRADELQRAIADTARQLADQGGGRHRISVHITSPDLGQVVVEIVSRGSEVRVTLQPQEAGVGGSLQQQQQAVARALATEGFTLSGFDVQTGHSDGHGREDAPQQQGAPALDDELDRIDLTATDDGALRL